MEKLVKILITFSTIVAILLVILVIAVIIHWIRTRAKTEKLLGSGNRGGNFVYDLLRTSFSKSRLIRRAVLPEFLPDGSVRRAPCDLILVERGGVFVIRVRNISGAVDNPPCAEWYVKTPQGVITIPNPFDQNKPGVRAVKEILRRENVFNVPIYSLVVFTGKRVVFRNRSEKLTTAETVLDTLRDFNRNRFLNQNEISSAIGAIKKYLPNTNPRTA